MKKNSRRLLLVAFVILGAIGLVVVSAVASVLAYRQFTSKEDVQADVVLDDVQLVDDESSSDLGVVILRVEPGSPAEQAGLSSGSVILSVNGKDVNTPQELKDLINEYEVGDSITLTVQDGEESSDVVVTLGDSGPYLGVNVGPAATARGFRAEGFDELPDGFTVPGFPGPHGWRNNPDDPQGTLPFEFDFDEFGLDEFDDTHGHLFDLLGSSALVMSATVDGPAEGAGLEAGDAIVEANGQSIENSQQLIDLISELSPGDELSLQVQRGEESISIEVTLASHPDDPDRAYLGVLLAPVRIPRQMDLFEERQNS